MEKRINDLLEKHGYDVLRPTDEMVTVILKFLNAVMDELKIDVKKEPGEK
jgi:hypothetical protein